MKRILMSVALAIVVPVGASHAGSSNNVYLLQDSSTELGNSIFIDQSTANASSVAGSANGLLPASQTGSGNVANLRLSGQGGTAILNQNNLILAGATGNEAVAVLSDYAKGTINQFGDGNTANLRVTGTLDGTGGTAGTVNQLGNRNDATLTVEGRGASGKINQLGSGNTNALEVTGTGTSATYTQIGNNAANPQGVTVVSNGGSVQITQFSF